VRGPCSPHRQGNVAATTFIGYQEAVDALKHMKQKPEFKRHLEVWRLDGKLGDNDSTEPGTDELKAFPGNNLGSFEFTPRGRPHSAGIPTSDLSRVVSVRLPSTSTREPSPEQPLESWSLTRRPDDELRAAPLVHSPA